MIIRLRIFILLLVCFSFARQVSAAKFYNVNSLYGISIREMNSVCEDDHGFIWASSKSGILRLTKNDYRTYTLPFEATDVFKVKLTYKNGRLFAYTNNGQFFLYNVVFDRFELLTSVSAHFRSKGLLIFDVLIDDSDVCWISTSGGLYKYQSGKVESAFQFSSNRHATAWLDNKQILIAKQDGIWLFNIHSFETKLIYENTKQIKYEFFAIYVDKELNKLWLTTRSLGLFLYDFDSGKYTSVLDSVLPKQPAFTIIKNSDSTCMVGYDGQGIWELDRRKLKVLNVYKENLDDTYSLRGNGVYDLLCDANNRIWICTYSGGLSYFDQVSPLINQVTHIVNNSNSLINNDVNSIIEDRWGKLWFATNNGISCWDIRSSKWQSFYSDKGTEVRVFKSLCEDNKGRIWAGSYSSGVYVLDGKTGNELAHYSKNDDNSPLQSDFIIYIYKDSDGDIWLGGVEGAVICYRVKEEKFRTYSKEYIGCIGELSKNNLILGCSSGLLLLNKETGSVKRLLSDITVRDFHVINEDIWVCTGGGGLIKYHFKSGESEKFTTQQGLPSNFVNSIQHLDDYLWLGTENGLCRFSLKDKNILTYPSIYSLSRVSFNNSSHLNLNNGQLAFGTNGGAVIFSPDLVNGASVKGKIFFQDLTIAGRSIRDISSFKLTTPIDSLKEIDLKYFQNTFSLELLSIGHSFGFKFSWKLDNLDQEWTTPSRNNLVSYANLPVGNYLLKIRLYDQSSTKILDERSIKINLIPPFWRTFWFDLLLFLVLAGVIMLYFFYYVNKLKQYHTEEKVRFFTKTAHDIRTSLTLIKAPTEELNNETNLSEKGRYFLNIAIEQGRRLSSVITQLMDFQKVDTGKEQIMLTMVDIVRFISNRKIMFESFAKSKNIDLVYNSNSENYISAVDEAKMEKIVDNLISNAIKYSPSNSQVVIDLQCSNKRWTLQVTDQGIGISKNDQSKLFKEFYRGENAINSKVIGSGIGLMLAKNYVAMHGGKISLMSHENTGSTFMIVIPFKTTEGRHNTEFHHLEQEHYYNYSTDVSDNLQNEKAKFGSSETKILIVEDNDDLLEFLHVALSREFKIFTAKDGNKAWELISKQLPDLVVSDIMMPNMDGYELCDLMKSTYETSHIPIVLLTALREKDEQMRGLGLGADDYLTKPFDMNLLVQKIRTIIRNREVVREKALKLIKNEATEPILQNEHNDKFLKKMLEVVKANISNSEFNKDDFASAMNVSSSLLYKKIKSLTDQSPSDFIKVVRLNYALELLQTKKYSVTEVSELSGFSSVRYFTTVFKGHFGKSPTKIQE